MRVPEFNDVIRKVPKLYATFVVKEVPAFAVQMGIKEGMVVYYNELNDSVAFLRETGTAMLINLAPCHLEFFKYMTSTDLIQYKI